jgi:uncharacterized protein
MTSNESEEARLLALLESQHDFPGPFTFKVIYRNDGPTPETVVAAVRQATGLSKPLGEPSQRASATSRFIALTLDFQVPTAARVLDVYAALRSIEGVISVF